MFSSSSSKDRRIGSRTLIIGARLSRESTVSLCGVDGIGTSAIVVNASSKRDSVASISTKRRCSLPR